MANEQETAVLSSICHGIMLCVLVCVCVCVSLWVHVYAQILVDQTYNEQ